MAAPLLFLALALAAKGSGEASVPFWGGSLLALWLAGALLKDPSPRAWFTPIAVPVWFFALWLVATNFFANPSYTVVAPFHAAFLLGGFLFGRCLAAKQVSLAFRIGVVFACALALGGLVLQFTMSEGRAHALFVTPATLGSVLNLFLLPVLVTSVFREGRRGLYVALLVLGAGFAAAQSRGAWIALGMAALFALALAKRARAVPEGTAMAKTAVAFALGGFTWWLVAMLWIGEASLQRLVDDAAPSLQARLELYALAWQGIQQSSWLSGAGYQAFYYLIAGAAASMPAYAGQVTYFVHNDYLQLWLELGLPGLVGLGFLTAWPIGVAAHALPKVTRRDEAMALIAPVAAIASLAMHSLSDFPFYIPLCALVLGAMLGRVDAALARSDDLPVRVVNGSPATAPLRRAAVAGVATVVVWILGMAVAAEAAAAHAFREWRAAHGQNAAFWFEAARRLQPRDWRFQWYAGQFWLAQAEETRKPELALRADRAFAASYAANPREARALYGRLMTQRRLRDLLPSPVEPQTMLAWAERLARLAPKDAGLLAERERIIQEFSSRR